ncbi:uncharacterized protein LOC125674828 [Ostrea edulis]|uniref:uncharacterized protein LOC125674828 n=1 Tax=Ostrea edulis TaxID=37623 RepID=UPI0024AF0943|nr:uncharacterized protein LOC125674828 [Ostrea edulis]
MTLIVKESVMNLAHQYKQKSQEFCEYLQRTNTEDSQQEFFAHTVILSKVDDKLETVLNELDTVIKNISSKVCVDVHEKSGHDVPKSTTSRSSLSNKKSRTITNSGSSSTLMKQRAKAEAAKAKLEFTMKEAELKKQQAKLEEEELFRKAENVRKSIDLQTELELLSVRKEKAVADAELQAMEQFELECDSNSEYVDSTERTRKYVADVIEYNDSQKNTSDTGPSHNSIVQPSKLNPEAETFIPPRHPTQILQNGMSSVQPKTHVSESATELPTQTFQSITTLQPKSESAALISAQTFPSVATSLQREGESTQFSRLTNHILKKDLMISRMTQFDDKAEHYTTWKTSFKSVCHGLNISPSEEMDLLIR